MTNYNELGKEYISYLSASGLVAYGTLKPQGAAVLSALRLEAVQRQRDKWRPTLTRDLLRLLSRLDTAFYYSDRVAHYLQEIEALPGGTGALGANMPDEDFCPPLQLMRNHKELGMEFESLILHSVAALDTLANLFANHCDGCKIFNAKGKPIQIYFKDAQTALANSVASDGRAQHLLDVLNECEPTLHDTVLSIGRKTLRNNLAHEAPIADLTESNFVIDWLPDGTVLRFDHEVYGMPLVASARSLIQTVSYLVMKSVAILLVASDSTVVQADQDAALGLKRDLCEPSWRNPVISWRDYVSTNKSDPEFTVVKTEADGFIIQHLHLSPEVFKHAVPFAGKR
jgi:hypothetical protein